MFAINYLCFIICWLVIHKYGVDSEPKNSGNSFTITHLPDAAQPWLYDLNITTDFKTSTFTGIVQILVKIVNSTNQILLNSKDLKIDSVELRNVTTKDTKQSVSYTLDPENELMIITPGQSGILAPNTYWKIIINYSGKLNDDMVGYYLSSYAVGNKTKWLAATQFESTYARMAFPCFDEPRFKATFKIWLYTEPQQSAISNMNKISTREEGSKICHEFSHTEDMSTYLVAFMVSEMSNASSSSTDYRYSVWARENEISNAQYALSIGPKCLEAMEMYTFVDYFLPKMDLVALPDLGFGAMENWGMITFRESAMLYNNDTSSEKNLQWVTLLIAHETAHQWFGDYVTPYWWDYLWLNEGFATYLEYKIAAKVQPAWRIDDFFVVDVLHKALFEDGAYIHHALTSPVHTPTEIDNYFDTISYQKGGSVLRMLEFMVSSETFRNALNQYLTAEHGGTTLVQPSNLWNAFEMYCKRSSMMPRGYNITDIMTRWTTYSGYPLVTASRVPVPMKQDIVIILQQEPYDASYRSASNQGVSKNKAWVIPISYTTKSSRNFMNANPTQWLTPGKNAVVNELLSPDEWIIVNIQQTGYYRVNYDLENWKLLTEQLINDPKAIHVLNRAQIIDDAWALAIDDKLPFSVPFALTPYLANELDPLPWFSAISKLDYVYSLFENTGVKELLTDFFLDPLVKQYNRLGIHVKETDDHLTKVLRPSIISFACRLGSKECAKHAELAFRENLSNLSKIPADVKSTAFCAAFNNGNFSGSEVWGKLWNLYSSSNSAHEKDALLYAAGCMKCRHHLKMYLGKLTNQSDHDIRKQDYNTVFRAVFSTPYGVTAALQFVDDAAKNIMSMDPREKRVIVRLLRFSKHKITTLDQMNILKKLNSEAENLKGKICTEYEGAVKAAFELGLKRTERILSRHGEIRVLFSKHTEEKSAGHSITPSMSTSSILLMFVSWFIYLQS